MDWTTNGGQFRELFRAVAHADTDELRTAAEALVVAFIYNTIT